MAIVRTVDKIRRNWASGYGIASMTINLSQIVLLGCQIVDYIVCVLPDGWTIDRGIPIGGIGGVIMNARTLWQLDASLQWPMRDCRE